MFGFRTPKRGVAAAEIITPPELDDASAGESSPSTRPGHQAASTLSGAPRRPAAPPNRVRLSVGEIEARSSISPPPPTKTLSQPTAPSKGKKPTALPGSKSSPRRDAPPAEVEKSPSPTKTYPSRVAEAKACVVRAKFHLQNSRNLKTDIKKGVTEAVDRLYALLKESEEKRPIEKRETEKPRQEREHSIQLEEKIDKHSKMLEENMKEMEKLKEALNRQPPAGECCLGRGSYASVAAGSPTRRARETTTMHSIIVASKDEQETGDQIYERLRRVVNATEEGARIDKVRKAKDRKIIVGCRNEDEIRKVKARITEGETHLSYEEVKNKDPLVILVLYGVLNSNTDDSIVKAIRTQNRNIVREAGGDSDRIEIRYRRRARNPLTSHIVARVSPQLWRSLTNAGYVHVDLQRVRVADQSPLVQCSRCLGYGHGRRFCPDAVDVCSHCSGPHVKSECPDFLSDLPATPCCINCSKAKMAKVDHNAFSNECPVRRKWDALARSSVAYC